MKMMVVDDDLQIRQGITYGIQWEEFGIEKTVCFSNAFDAINELKEEYFDIILTDISMPKMSGIDLLKYVKENYPEILVILISGYEEFEYAKAGIKYGAEEYILKPIHLDILTETVFNAIEKIRKNKEHISSVRENKKNHFIKMLLSENIRNETEIRQFLRDECGFQNPGVLMGVVVQSDGGSNLFLNEEVNRIMVKNFTESLTGYQYNVFDINGDEKYLLLWVADSTLLILNIKNHIKNMLDEINKQLGEKGSVSASIVAPFSTGEISKSYQHGVEMLKLSYFEGEGHCFIDDNIRPICKNSRKELMEIEDLLIDKLDSVSDEELCELLEHAKKALKHHTKDEVQNFVIISITEALNKYNKKPLESNYQEDILGIMYFDTLMDFWKHYLLEFKHELQQTNRYSREVGFAVEYIRKHFSEKVTVERIAEELQISPGHLARAFKKETGVLMKKYINEFRIQKAVKLLSDTNMKVYEVAETVGISDYMYFTQVFRNVTGKSPTDVRRQNNKN